MTKLRTLGPFGLSVGRIRNGCRARVLGWGRTACATVLLSAATATVSTGQTLKPLTSFNGIDGAFPEPALVQAINGNFYGTTFAGGISAEGTVFEITPSGKLATLYSFCSLANCADGYEPREGSLVQATDGNLYGTTVHGGANCPSVDTCGTVFEITPAGKLTTVYSFCQQANCADGQAPEAGLIQAANGNLYGTTYGGGAACPLSGDSCGTVFEITPAGKLTTVYSFCQQANCPDGQAPAAPLVQAADGNLYGTTGGGGANGVGGTVFEITPAGNLTTLYSFCSQVNCTDGAGSTSGLVQATNGNFYGTAQYGGANGYGTVFEITPGGKLTTLYSFCQQANCTDGSYPYAGLIQATNGNFYGTTEYGGANPTSCGFGNIGCGTVFEITPGSKVTTLYSFCSQADCADGTLPTAGLIQATNGRFYGTTLQGGMGQGIVFSLSVGLGPFVETLQTSGKVGAAVKILGTNLTDATSVTFNGTSAVFKVVSRSLITTTVPSGATTGNVQVTTPSATLISNVPFQVLSVNGP
jgi:uncharacterized repeat protein (TIGR03803 family)